MGEAVTVGVGVAPVVDSEIMPPGTRIASSVTADALSMCAAAVEVPVGVGDAVTVGVAVEVPVGVGDTVTVGVAVGELVGDAVTVGVGVVDVPLLITTLVISSLSSLLRSSRVNSSSAFPSVIVNDFFIGFRTIINLCFNNKFTILVGQFVIRICSQFFYG